MADMDTRLKLLRSVFVTLVAVCVTSCSGNSATRVYASRIFSFHSQTHFLRDVAAHGGVASVFVLPALTARAFEQGCERGHAALVYLARPSFLPAVVQANTRQELLLRMYHCSAHFVTAPTHLKFYLDAATHHLWLSDTNFGADSTYFETTNPTIARAVVAYFAGFLRAGASGTTLVTPAPVHGNAWIFSPVKSVAERLEARLLADGPSPQLSVATESFGPSPVLRTLVRAAARGATTRLLVGAAEAKRGRRTLLLLARAGIRVRIDATNEKEALTSSGCYVGSANASGGSPSVQRQPDWGLIDLRPQGGLCRVLAQRFAQTWAAARPL